MPRRKRTTRHSERHRSEHIGWLRAAVLGANDGILSTAGLVVGVASAQAPKSAVMLAGFAGLVAGGFSMAAGEYVSVSSQTDTETADRTREEQELATDPAGEREELVNIYVGRGLDRALAGKVADQMMAHDALGAHLRDELGLSETLRARPIQAALTSAATFAAGSALPLLAVVPAPVDHVATVVAGVALFALGVLGAVAARAGGAPAITGAARVLFWGALAMAATAAIGRLSGVAV
ncbi:VIT1/CCC1 transporter family protein [Dokdonella fugitiva]|jgi:VIT1/CCC1 family predicted Fe2+/Mn2+ transporter|uniref:VIT1/CCC1 transporter family protein n=1 Tax=Dokdonella fugitiva TaxID=328517 RepID=UPI0015FCACCB|nr:VIT family protein [Dokdonella fugitiva]MBA8883698.1 VIT1/CCC1 family predicted Fe2+/Mn2+ transporter [Dokdonella fugitiva]